MKKCIIISLLMLLAISAIANPVDVKTAQKVAENHLYSKSGIRAELQLLDYADKAEFPNFYVFGTNNSFVIISADDCVQPVLGYSTKNPFGTEKMPENLFWWLKGYDEQIAQAIKNKQEATIETAKEWRNLLNGKGLDSKSNTTVAPLIQTIWGQGTPFNNLCPLDANHSSGHAITGCVATSMAQLIYYYYHDNTLTNGIGSHSYNHPTYGLLSVDFSATPYDWDNMKEDYNGSYNSEQAVAVATLMYHCGVAVNMSYGTSASSAFSSDIPSALINYFNFSVTTEHRRRYSSDSTDYWIADLKNELDNGRPMEYNGTGSGGHSFICDGYDDNNNFHFNWGWYGSYNTGYYPIDNLTPGNHNYSFDQGAVFGIKPASCETSAPINFNASLIEGTRNVQLTWTAVSDAEGYNVFRNGMLIESLMANQTNYTDNQIPYGTNIYHIRSVDSNGEMSLPTDYKTITIEFLAPSGLSASLSNGIVNLSWNHSQNSTSYNIYRNNVLIATNITSNTFNDNLPTPGNTTYYVKGVDVLGDESDASNSVSLNIPYQIPIARNLCLSLSNENPYLSWTAPYWCYPQTSSGQLSYGDGKLNYLWGAVYFAHRHLATDLVPYINKSIYKVSTRISYLGTYTVYIYTNSIDDQPDPEALRETRVLNSTNGGWVDIDLSEPILITGDKDIWIVFKQENTDSNYPVPSFDLTEYNVNACYASMSSPTSLSVVPNDYPISWYIKAHLTDGTYTYNLYDGNTKINGDVPISGTSYSITEPLDEGIHQFTVKTNYYGGVSAASNKAGVVVGTPSLETLVINAGDAMTLIEGSTLTVTGTLTNANPDNLILEDGAQLIHNSENVMATVKRHITPYTADDNGWNFIANPTTSVITPSEGNGFLNGNDELNTYDLYYYDEPTSKWKNYENNTFDINPQQGYLYANGEAEGTTLVFQGELNPSNTHITITGLSHSATNLNGFNLVGNPFACNATVDKDCYVISGNKVILAETQPQIAPCEGIMVKATNLDQTVTFTKVAPSKGDDTTNNIDLVVTQDNTLVDRARIRFGNGNGMEKFTLNEPHSLITLDQNGQEFAVVFDNNQNEIPINFKAIQDGTYTISLESAQLNYDYLHLIDNIAGADVDLLVTPSYSFEERTDDYPSRFRLLFKSTDENHADTDDVIEGDVQILDLTGRIVLSRRNGVHTISTLGLTPGVYILRTINGNEIKNEKIVVKGIEN